MILCFSVVARMKTACAGGSSSVLRKALKAAAEYVDLVDDEHRVAAHLRNDAHLLDQRADVLHRIVRRGVQPWMLSASALAERAAPIRTSLHARRRRGEAVDGLGEDAGAGGLAHAAGPQKRVGQLAAFDGVLERRGDSVLARRPNGSGRGRYLRALTMKSI